MLKSLKFSEILSKIKNRYLWIKNCKKGDFNFENLQKTESVPFGLFTAPSMVLYSNNTLF